MPSLTVEPSGDLARSTSMLDRRLLPILATLVPVALVAAWLHVFRESTEWVTPFEWVVSGGLLVAALATVVATWARWRGLAIGIAAFLLTANTAFVVSELFGVHLIPTQGFASDKFAAVLAAGTLLAIGGLIARRQWARWLALALGAAGIGCGVINGIAFWTFYDWNHPWYLEFCNLEWVNIATAAGGMVIVTNLVAARESFVANPTWNRPDPLVRWLRLMMIASFLAVPMLLVYSWMQPIVPATQTTGLVLAAALALGGFLAVRGKVAGALLLVAAGLGLVAQTLATWQLADEPVRRISYYYAVFWTPAAIIAIVCGVLMARPMLRLLRR